MGRAGREPRDVVAGGGGVGGWNVESLMQYPPRKLNCGSLVSIELLQSQEGSPCISNWVHLTSMGQGAYVISTPEIHTN